jgi:hypothetical protein
MRLLAGDRIEFMRGGATVSIDDRCSAKPLRQTTHPAGNLRSAHFHSHFDGVEPTDRIWPDEIKTDPTGWLAGELCDLAHVLTRASVDHLDADTVERDAAGVRDAIPAIIAAVEATWDSVRSAPV